VTRLGTVVGRWTPAPLALLMLFWPSVKWSAVGDGAETEFYGLPLPWNSRGLATSLSKTYYLLPLIADGLFWLGVSWLICRLWRGRAFMSSARVDGAMGALIWSAAFLSALWFGLIILVTWRDGYWTASYEGGWRIVRVTPSPGY
jgi:hypothetical protein